MAQTWSVVHTKISRELSTAVAITSLGFPTFYPLHRRKRIHNHRVEHLIGPLFPRYLFVRFDRDQDEWGEILTTKGVCDIIRDCERRPCILRDDIMTAMKARLEASPETPEPDPVYSVGQRLRITDGVLEGLEGLFEGTAQQRTCALLEIMGRRVKVPIKSVRAA